MREVMTQLHQESHWGIQPMCDAILGAYYVQEFIPW
jgi:hypothetical protein